MANVFLIACACALGAIVAHIVGRTLATRRVQSRQERLKAHLDWVNPMPQTSRRRGLLRR